MSELQEILDNILAEAEAAVEAERDEVQYLTLCLIVSHRVPRMAKALKVLIQAMRHEGGTVLNDALSRALAILEGEKDG